MKQNQMFFHRTYSNMTSFFVGRNILNISMTFASDTFQFHCKSEHKQVK